MKEGMRLLDPFNVGDQKLILQNTAYKAKFNKDPNYDDFQFASYKYIMRRGRRIHLAFHNAVQE